MHHFLYVAAFPYAHHSSTLHLTNFIINYNAILNNKGSRIISPYILLCGGKSIVIISFSRIIYHLFLYLVQIQISLFHLFLFPSKNKMLLYPIPESAPNSNIFFHTFLNFYKEETFNIKIFFLVIQLYLFAIFELHIFHNAFSFL